MTERKPFAAIPGVIKSVDAEAEANRHRSADAWTNENRHYPHSFRLIEAFSAQHHQRWAANLLNQISWPVNRNCQINPRFVAVIHGR